jgi:IS1 family transposase
LHSIGSLPVVRSFPWEIGDRSEETYRRLYDRIRRKYTVDYLCTDKYAVYSKMRYDSIHPDKYIPEKYKEPSDNEEEVKHCSKHIRSKSETCFIESLNSRIRTFLARFNRRTIRISKTIEMLYYSLLLLFNEFYWGLALG